MLVVAGVLVLAQLALRAWLLSGRTYHQDDFRLIGRAATSSLWSPEYLVGRFDGHFMPGSMLVAGILERLAPMNWTAVVLVCLLLQALASLAVLRMLRIVLGDGPRLLLPLVFALFVPLTLGAVSWWAATLNSLPLQIGLAWFVGDAVRHVRTGDRRSAVTGWLVLGLTYCFYVKAVLIAPVAFAAVAVLLRAAGEPRPLAAAWQRGRRLWTGSAVVTGVWALAYRSTVGGSDSATGTPEDVLDLAWHGLLHAVLPGVVGGPWVWGHEAGSTPYASTPGVLLVAAAAVVAMGVLWARATREGGLLVCVLAAAHSFGGLVVVGVGRTTELVGSLPPLALRHFAGDVVVLALAGALLMVLPLREQVPPAVEQVRAALPRGRARHVVPVGLAVLFVASSLFSTVAYRQQWESDRVGDYLATVRTDLAATGRSPMLDQAVPADLLWGLAAPDNLASRALASLPGSPGFADATDDLRLVDDQGHVLPARVEPARRVTAGPSPSCGHAAVPGMSATLPLDGPMIAYDWTAQLEVAAEADGVLTVALGTGRAVAVPVRQGVQTVYVRLAGDEGTELRVASPTVGGTRACIRSGSVGLVTAG
ncbi:hypothetical protein GB931_06685 [Modestobacter sp. I12A-02628]|uniref:Uncharacterized protein n=1 Tax=Goekera deserti TaxID=2497753 RepID=A0A7K3WB05_9ACTN|nr:hypothetical protein [Goekera deserti]MPQ97610.1 hypothetical protein [Goekera deserti]NDI47786.1 hypothetical protein [Goekera deserti]NEL53534.1 hypothetical protein [Goekera deserti]